MPRLSPFCRRLLVSSGWPISATIALAIVTMAALPSRAQILNRRPSLERVNGRLAGQVIDYTKARDCDRRIFSPILGRPRDLYIYLPPEYDPACAYPLVLFFHMADVDEQYFVRSQLLIQLDDMIARGEFPPAVFACPDGTYDGWTRLNFKHSLYINGLGGRFEDHIVQVLPSRLSEPFAIVLREPP